VDDLRDLSNVGVYMCNDPDYPSDDLEHAQFVTNLEPNRARMLMPCLDSPD
jgi:aminopeptidase N